MSKPRQVPNDGPTPAVDPDLDLTITRIIKAPRAAVWDAWAERTSFEQWRVPAPARCRVVEMDLRPGGAFVTEISGNGGAFGPHLNACILVADRRERVVFTSALTAGWRPAAHPFITAIITMRDHPGGTEYAAHVMHKSVADRTTHDLLGFYDGWGTVGEQLATLVESRV